MLSVGNLNLKFNFAHFKFFLLVDHILDQFKKMSMKNLFRVYLNVF